MFAPSCIINSVISFQMETICSHTLPDLKKAKSREKCAPYNTGNFKIYWNHFSGAAVAQTSKI